MMPQRLLHGAPVLGAELQDLAQKVDFITGLFEQQDKMVAMVKGVERRKSGFL